MKRLLTALFCALSTACVFADASHKTVDLTIVNASDAKVCVFGNNASTCLGHGSKAFSLQTQNYYHRHGVIRISINGKPAVIGMLKNHVNSADLYITKSDQIHASAGTFEPKSFVYSDNLDYLHFVAKPNYLFTAYPA